MSRNQIAVAASPEAVFEVLDDADAHPRWVVGARRTRRVDADWPAHGSEFHHAVGLPGAELHDSTQVVERVPLHRITLEVRFRPTGTAQVELVVDETADGSVVTMDESPHSGPVSWLPWFVTDPLLHARNAWSLQRLRHEMEQRSAVSSGRSRGQAGKS
jgi:uncharacterized protein YndB with AHSA1/START domain